LRRRIVLILSILASIVLLQMWLQMWWIDRGARRVGSIGSPNASTFDSAVSRAIRHRQRVPSHDRRVGLVRAGYAAMTTTMWKSRTGCHPPDVETFGIDAQAGSPRYTRSAH